MCNFFVTMIAHFCFWHQKQKQDIFICILMKTELLDLILTIHFCKIHKKETYCYQERCIFVNIFLLMKTHICIKCWWRWITLSYQDNIGLCPALDRLPCNIYNKDFFRYLFVYVQNINTCVPNMNAFVWNIDFKNIIWFENCVRPPKNMTLACWHN